MTDRASKAPADVWNPMAWSKRGGGRSLDGRRRVGALLGVWALLAQIALPSLHAWVVARGPSRSVARVWASDGTAPQLTARARRLPIHDASDCPVCRSVVQARRFLSPPAPTLAATPQSQPHDANPTTLVESTPTSRAASPRAPPRRA
jgi:hypothetical protein